MTKTDYRIFPGKFNPYHDERGRFTSGGGAVQVSRRTGRGWPSKERMAEATGARAPVTGEALASAREFAKTAVGGEFLRSKHLHRALNEIAQDIAPGKVSTPQVAVSLAVGSRITARYDGAGWGGRFMKGDLIELVRPAVTVSVAKNKDGKVAVIMKPGIPGSERWSSANKIAINKAKLVAVENAKFDSADGPNMRSASIALTASVFHGWRPPPLAKKAVDEDKELVSAAEVHAELESAVDDSISEFLKETEKYTRRISATKVWPSYADMLDSLHEGKIIAAKFNPHHDERGRFTSGQGASNVVSWIDWSGREKPGKKPESAAPAPVGGTAVAASAPGDAKETVLSTGKITNVEDIAGGGVNTTFKGYIDGKPVVIKPESGLAKGRLRDNIPPGHDMERERAGYLVAQRMGIEAPATVIRDVPGKGRAMVQEWVEDAKEGRTFLRRAGLEEKDLKNYKDIALYDAVIGNTDRHGRNYMVKPDGKIIPIDHGLAFPQRGKSWGNEQIIEARIFAGDKKLASSEIKKLRELKDDKEFKSKISTTLNDDAAVKNMYSRIDKLLMTEEIDTVGNINP